jgi:Zn-finger nucleic acid-binding protein
MQCPIDSTPRQFFEGQGVEMDYCPQCRELFDVQG